MPQPRERPSSSEKSQHLHYSVGEISSNSSHSHSWLYSCEQESTVGTESACKKSRVSGHFQPSPGSAPSPSRFPPHAPQVLFPLQTGTTTAASLPPAAVAQNTDSLQPQKHNKNPTEPEPRPGAREPRRERVPPPAATAQAPAGPGGTTGFLCYVLQRKGVMETRSGEGGTRVEAPLGSGEQVGEPGIPGQGCVCASSEAAQRSSVFLN